MASGSSQYGNPSPMEQFHVVFAAGERDDQAEIAKPVGSRPGPQGTSAAHAPHRMWLFSLSHVAFMDSVGHASAGAKKEPDEDEPPIHWQRLMDVARLRRPRRG
jgi:hypothetical protein